MGIVNFCFLISQSIWDFDGNFAANENCHKFRVVVGQHLSEKKEQPNDSCKAVNKI